MKKIICSITAIILSMAVLAGCGNGSKYETAMNAAYEPGAVEYECADMGLIEEKAAEINNSSEAGEFNAELPSDMQRKLIRNVDLSVETEEFDSLMRALEERVAKLGGYVEQMNINNGSTYYGGSNRFASVTARIPAEHLDSFLEMVAVNSNITYRSEQVQDVTLEYVDVESHLSALRAQQDRLLELVEQAETVEELVCLETELSEVRYQIQSMESQLRVLSNQVSYSTVEIAVEEVTVYTPQAIPKTAGQRIREGFVRNCLRMKEGVSEFFINVLIAVPFLVVWGMIILVIVLIIRVCLKRRKKKYLQNPYVPNGLQNNESQTKEEEKTNGDN